MTTRISLLSLVVLAVSCAGPTTPAAQNSLAAFTPIPAGAVCPTGGVTLTSGLDTNSSGVLDASEVLSTTQICNGSSTSADALVKTTMLAIGSTACPFGGTQLDSGLDNGEGGGTADNGTLEQGEIDSTSNLCNTAPAGALVSTTALAFGSAACPTGGTRIDSGLDNGDGSGTAGNGTLEAGEVDSTISLCNGAGQGAFDLARPAGPAGTAKIKTNGGARTGGVTVAGPAGRGGKLSLGESSQPSSFLVADTGLAVTTHTVPTITPALGTDGETVTANTTVTEIGGVPLDNQLYIDKSVVPARLVRYRSAPTARYTAVTGLRINPNVTLTISQSVPVTPFVVDGDLDVQGTLTTVMTAGNVRQSLELSARNVLVAATGSITLSPIAGGSANAAGSLVLTAAGTLLNAGTISTAASFHVGPVATGGGDMALTATSFYNTGTITTEAATAVNAGATAGDLTVNSTRALVHDGVITTTGGSGSSGGGAGDVFFELTGPTQSVANDSIYITGAINAVGGTCAVNGQTGGLGGLVRIYATNARIRHNAPIKTSGGSPRLASGIVTAGDCASGSGGAIDFLSILNDASWDAAPMIEVSGSLDTSGADGVRGGGSGGDIKFRVERAQGGLVRLLGYSSIELSGGTFGDGPVPAGNLVHSTTFSLGGSASFVPEQIHIYSAINANGGGAVIGGQGGLINIGHNIDGTIETARTSTAPSLIFAGPISARGGEGGSSSGSGGALFVHGFGNAELRSTIDLTGGSSSLGNPSLPGVIVMDMTGTLTVTGAVTVNGTDQAVLLTPSNGGSISLAAGLVTVSGAITARGGNSAVSRPGDGGGISVQSRNGASVVTGALNVSAGTGATGTPTNFAALTGTIVIDGLAR